MTTTIVELDTALRGLRLSEKSVTLQARALQVAAHEMDFVEALLWTVQDELYRRRSRLLDWRYALSGPPARKDLKSFDWTSNARLPKCEILALGTLNFIDVREDVLMIGPPRHGEAPRRKSPGREGGGPRLQGLLP